MSILEKQRMKACKTLISDQNMSHKINHTFWSSTFLTIPTFYYHSCSFWFITVVIRNQPVHTCQFKQSKVNSQVYSLPAGHALCSYRERKKGFSREGMTYTPLDDDPSWCENEESNVEISKYVQKNIFYLHYVQLCTVGYIWQKFQNIKKSRTVRYNSLYVSSFLFYLSLFPFFRKSGVYYANLALVIMIEVYN